MTPNRRRIEALVMRMQNAFLDAPRLRLSLQGTQQRFGIDHAACAAVLDALVDAAVLARTPDGTYERFFPHAVDRGDGKWRDAPPLPWPPRRHAHANAA